MKENKYFVTMTDRYMSGWGKAQGLTNKLVFICDTLEDAEIVESNALRRSEMKYVNVCHSTPAYYKNSMGDGYVHGGFYVSVKTKETAGNWYKPNYF